MCQPPPPNHRFRGTQKIIGTKTCSTGLPGLTPASIIINPAINLLCRSCELDPETCNPELKIASSIYKRNPYAFGLGKRDPYAFGLGKRSTLSFGLGKREPYAFGLGKRSSNIIQPFMMMAPGNEESQTLCLTKRRLFWCNTNK